MFYVCVLHNASGDEKWAKHRMEQIMATKQLECVCACEIERERVPGTDYYIIFGLYLTALHSVRLWC